MFKSIKFTMMKNKTKSPFRLKNIIFSCISLFRKAKKGILNEKIIVFYRYDVINIDDVIDCKFCLRQQIEIDYISFKSPFQDKANDASSKSLCIISNRKKALKLFNT